MTILLVVFVCFFALPLVWNLGMGAYTFFGGKTKAEVIQENTQLRSDLDKVFDIIEQNNEAAAKIEEAKEKSEAVIEETKKEVKAVKENTAAAVTAFKKQARDIIKQPKPVVSAEQPNLPDPLSVASINVIWDAYNSAKD